MLADVVTYHRWTGLRDLPDIRQSHRPPSRDHLADFLQPVLVHPDAAVVDLEACPGDRALETCTGVIFALFTSGRLRFDGGYMT
jgi:hypothetical protein